MSTMTVDVARVRPAGGSSARVHQSEAPSAGTMAPPMRTHVRRGAGRWKVKVMELCLV